MIWPFTRNKNGATKSADPTPEEVAAAEAEAEKREKRRDAAQKRIIESLREAQEARGATISMEADHVKATEDRRKKADTTIRQAQEKATEISDTICPIGPKPKPSTQPEEAGA